MSWCLNSVIRNKRICLVDHPLVGIFSILPISLIDMSENFWISENLRKWKMQEKTIVITKIFLGISDVIFMFMFLVEIYRLFSKSANFTPGMLNLLITHTKYFKIVLVQFTKLMYKRKTNCNIKIILSNSNLLLYYKIYDLLCYLSQNKLNSLIVIIKT